jgi:hypothetical protein
VQFSDALVSELKSQSTRVCPLVCPDGKIAQGERCVVAEQPKPAAPQKSQGQASTSVKHNETKQAVRPAPTVRQEASGNTSSGHATIGVGF